MPKTGTRNGTRNWDQKCPQNATRQQKKTSQPAKNCKPKTCEKVGPKTDLVPKMSTTRQRFVTFRCLRFLGSVLVLKAGTLIGSSGCASLGIIQVSTVRCISSWPFSGSENGPCFGAAGEPQNMTRRRRGAILPNSIYERIASPKGGVSAKRAARAKQPAEIERIMFGGPLYS